MSSSFLSGPIAPESNPPINPQYYQPSRFVIAAISMGATTTVTTSVDNNYVVGQLVRLLIPQYWGATQLNFRQGYVVNLPASNQVTLDINSLGNTPLMPPLFTDNSKNNLPQIIGIGDVNTGRINATGRTGNGTFILGSFIDIS